MQLHHVEAHGPLGDALQVLEPGEEVTEQERPPGMLRIVERVRRDEDGPAAPSLEGVEERRPLLRPDIHPRRRESRTTGGEASGEELLAGFTHLVADPRSERVHEPREVRGLEPVERPVPVQVDELTMMRDERIDARVDRQSQ